MDEKFFKQLVAELVESQSQALQLLTVAVSKQIDRNQLLNDLLDSGDRLDDQGKLPALTKRLVKDMVNALLDDRK